MNAAPDTGLLFLFALVVVVLYVWTAWAMATLFRQFWAKAWKAWVPVLSQSEVFALGGYSPWAVLLLFVPIVNIYGLVLYIRAAHRVTAMSGRSGGVTVLAVLLPPVWASVLAWGRTPPRNQRLEPDVERAAQGTADSAIPELVDALAPASGAASTVALPAAAAPTVLSPFEPAARPTVPVLRTAVVPLTRQEPADRPPTTIGARILGYEEPVNIDEVFAFRRSTTRWFLAPDVGDALPLPGEVVVLGRNPTAAAGEQTLWVPDPSRTLSKTHARLVFTEGAWTITDLGATNGVLVVDEYGRERVLEPHVPAHVTGKVMLGELVLRIIENDEDQEEAN